MLAVTFLARRRRIHCRGSDAAAAALELELRRCGAGDLRHRLRAEPAPPAGLPGRGGRPPRAPHSRQGRRRLLDGPRPAGSGRWCPAAGAERGPRPAAADREGVPAAGDAGTEVWVWRTASAASSEASSVLCAVCLEEVRGRGKAAAAAEATTLPCSHAYHPGCLQSWLAVHRACPCCRAAVPSSIGRDLTSESGSTETRSKLQ